MDEKKLDEKPDPRIEFAKQRTFLAIENTMMSWVRTSLALIGFGIGIFEAFQKKDEQGIFRNSRLVGLSMILLGIVAVILAIAQAKREQKTIQQDDFFFQKKSSLAIKVGYALMLIGLIGLVSIIIQFLS